MKILCNLAFLHFGRQVYLWWTWCVSKIEVKTNHDGKYKFFLLLSSSLRVDLKVFVSSTQGNKATAKIFIHTKLWYECVGWAHVNFIKPMSTFNFYLSMELQWKQWTGRMMLYVTSLFTSSFTFVFFPFLFNSYIMKYSFLVALSLPITFQCISCMALMTYWGYCSNDHMKNIYMIRFLWLADEMMRR